MFRGWWFGSCDNNLNGYHYSSESVYNTSTCTLEITSAVLADKGAGISYPVQISYQKTQIALYQKHTLKNIDYETLAQDFCNSP